MPNLSSGLIKTPKSYKASILNYFMKKSYPNYRTKGGVEFINLMLKPKDKKVFNDFLDYCRITAGESKIRNIRMIMLQIYDVMERPYYSISLSDLRKFLAVLNQSDKLTETQNDIKKTLKRFLKWYYKNWNERFEELRDIRTKDGMNHKKLNPSAILKKEEIEKLIRSAESLRYKAMIMLMFESASRPEEILKLRWSDLDLNKGEVKLHSSKTGSVRVNPIQESIIHLERYKQEYPFSDVKANDFVFPSPNDRNKQVTHSAIYDYLKIIGLRALGKHIYPYLLRHTRLTEIHKLLPTQVACKFAGHSPEMAKRYTHLSNDDVREAMLEKIYHIEELTKEGKDKLEMKLNLIEKKLKETIQTSKKMQSFMDEWKKNPKQHYDKEKNITYIVK